MISDERIREIVPVEASGEVPAHEMSLYRQIAQEAAEEMRERCAEEVESRSCDPFLADAIRKLPTEKK